MVEDRKHAAALQHVDEGILGIEKLVERWQHLVRVGVEVGIRVTVRVGVGLRVGVGVGVRVGAGKPGAANPATSSWQPQTPRWLSPP